MQQEIVLYCNIVSGKIYQPGHDKQNEYSVKTV